jgi:hypothetical protein
MPGGLLNIVAYGNQNLILNGNPCKTFFKSAYSKYTNFGLQKFRIDFKGQRTLRLNEDSTFLFKVPRYADLLMDTYLVISLPNIWSPVYPPQDCSGSWAPYEFKWIENLGTQMIRDITISIGGQIIQKYSGQYLYNMIERDFEESKKKLYYEMTGHTPELNDPANATEHRRNNAGIWNMYPSVYLWDQDRCPSEGYEPSIRARKLYIPINSWFTLMSKMAFPLVSLQYNELHIEVTMRPIKELFTIRDVQANNSTVFQQSPSNEILSTNDCSINCFPPCPRLPSSTYKRLPYVQPNFNNALHHFYRFLQMPPDISLNTTSYDDKRTLWDADIHLISTYCFLSRDEVRVFAAKEQKYLIKEIYERPFYNVAGTKRVDLDSLGMVKDWTWYFQRNDVNLRNEWSNYSNWPYKELPVDVLTTASINNPEYTFQTKNGGACDCSSNPSYQWIANNANRSGSSGLYPTYFNMSPLYSVENQKNILLNTGILLDGKYRENVIDAGVYNYIEKYVRSTSNLKDGVYFYNFGLNTNPYDFQPSGAMNMSKFSTVQFEFTTYPPPLDPSAHFYTICDASGVIGVNKTNWQIYDYNYNLNIMEERYNILSFIGGNAALMYAR